MNKILQDHLAKLQVLCRRCKVKTMYSFGSVNTSRFTDESDIDLLVDFEQGISVEEYTDNYFTLHQELAALFQRKIDLVTFRSLSNPFFIENVEQSKSLVYGVS